MLLLTWHGTILRVEPSQNRLIHAPLVPARAVARDLAYEDALPGGMILAPGPAPGSMVVMRDDRVLTASPDVPFPAFEAGPAGAAHAVLALTEAQVATLRALLSRPHCDESGAPISAALQAGFGLKIGPHAIDLATFIPAESADGTIFAGVAGTLSPLPAGAPAREIALSPAPPPPPTAEAAAFQAADAATLVIAGAPELRFLPLAARFATRNWFYEAAEVPPETGPRTAQNLVRRQRDAGLLGGATIFTEAGVLHGPLPPAGAWPAGLSREADHFFIDAASVEASPCLAGPHAFLPTPSASLLLETILPLVLMAPHLPPETTLLMPPGVEPDLLAPLLALFGFSDPAWVVAPLLCRVEALFWPARCAPVELAAEIPQATRARFAARNAPREGTRRGLLVPTGIVNSARIAAVAADFGFDCVEPEPLSPAALAARFADARAVLAAHGAVLDSLVFCAPGTLVVEITADTVWDGRYSRLSDQLGLTHAVLPCAREPGGLRPDPRALRALLRLLKTRA